MLFPGDVIFSFGILDFCDDECFIVVFADLIRKNAKSLLHTTNHIPTLGISTEICCPSS